MRPSQIAPIAARQPALDICRGVGRLLSSHGVACINEFSLANDRRADVIGLSASAQIWIVEVKSCAADFMSDRKWPEYRPFCDRFFFAVAPDFPAALLPPDAGHIIAHRFGGEIVRDAPELRISAARRKSITLKLFRTAAFRLHEKIDPGLT